MDNKEWEDNTCEDIPKRILKRTKQMHDTKMMETEGNEGNGRTWMDNERK